MTNDELRIKNRATVERFFKTHGEERANLFTEDGSKEIPYPASFGQTWRWDGKAAVLKNFTSNIDLFVDWTWKDLKLDETLDPNKLWVEATGTGRQAVNDLSKPRAYTNHYIFCFEMRDGLIFKMREFHNPLALLDSLGVELPRVPSPDETDAKNGR